MPNPFEKIAEKEKQKAVAKQNQDAERFARKVADEVVGSIADLSFQDSVAQLATTIAKAIALSSDATNAKLDDSFSLLLDAVRKDKTNETQIELSLKIGEQLAALEDAFNNMEVSPTINVAGISVDDLRAEIAKIVERLPSDSKRIVTLAYEDVTPDKYLNVRLTDGINFYKANGRGGGGGGSINISGLATSAKQDNVIAELQQLRGFQLPVYDEIEATYPTSSTELYTYKFETTEVATVQVTYTDSTKEVLSGVIFNAS